MGGPRGLRNSLARSSSSSFITIRIIFPPPGYAAGSDAWDGPVQPLREKLGHLENGSDTFLQAAAQYIRANGGEIRLQSPVSKVHIRHNAVHAVETEGLIERFEKVQTIPCRLCRESYGFAPANSRSYTSVDNIAVVCASSNSQSPSHRTSGSISMTRRWISPGLWNIRTCSHWTITSSMSRFTCPGVIPIFRNRTSGLRTGFGYLRTINPGIGAADIIDVRASRYRFAQPICEPGFGQKLPPVELPVGGLWVADYFVLLSGGRGIAETVAFVASWPNWLRRAEALPDQAVYGISGSGYDGGPAALAMRILLSQLMSYAWAVALAYAVGMTIAFLLNRILISHIR